MAALESDVIAKGFRGRVDGMLCSLQNVRYEFVADVYVLAVELSIAIPRRMDRSWIKRSIVQGCRTGCLDSRVMLIIF